MCSTLNDSKSSTSLYTLVTAERLGRWRWLLLWKFKNMVYVYRSSYTHLRASRRAPIDRYNVELYTRLVGTYYTVDAWHVDAKDMSEQGATISSCESHSLLSL
jgi:hypothetical protein